MGTEYRVGKNHPPLEHRFSVDNPPPKRKSSPRGPYLTPLLKKLIEKKIKYEDPETQKVICGRVKDAIVWRLILNATQGDNEAIKEIFNRLDGKLIDAQIDQSRHYHITHEYRTKPKDTDSALRPTGRPHQHSESDPASCS